MINTIVVGKQRYHRRKNEREDEFFSRVMRESAVHPFWIRRLKCLIKDWIADKEDETQYQNA